MSLEPEHPPASIGRREGKLAAVMSPVGAFVAVVLIASAFVLWIALASPQPGTVAGLGGAAVLFSAALAFLNGHLSRKHETDIDRGRREDAAHSRAQTERHERARLEELTTSRTQTANTERARLQELFDARGQAHRRETIRDLRSRFATAAAQLADPAAPVRLAGVYSLGSLADDWGNLYKDGGLEVVGTGEIERQVCIDLLCAYLRNDTANELTLLSKISTNDVRALADVLAAEEQRVRAAILALIQTHTTVMPEYQDNPTWRGSKFDLSAAKLPGALLDSSELDYAFMVGTELIEADLKGIQLRKADLGGAILDKAWLVGARLEGSKMLGASLFGAHLHGVSFAGCLMDGVDFDGTTCGAANFTRARLVGAKFVGAELDYANFAGARLGNATFAGCKLNRVSFDGTDLRGTNFSDAQFTDTTTFRGVQVDSDTTWPDGTNDLPAGVTLQADTNPEG
jgi:uncharacterized protein YjbI with pentapeptide repeats